MYGISSLIIYNFLGQLAMIFSLLINYYFLMDVIREVNDRMTFACYWKKNF